MGTTNDDVKQELLDLLAKEPQMVLSTAYVYAKNYVQYGEDITKARINTAQQLSVLQEVRQKAWAVAYDDFKADYEDLKKDYENRLKAEKVAMLEELKKEIEELDFFEGEKPINITQELMDEVKSWGYGVKDCKKLIQSKINKLKGEEDGNK